MGKHYTRYIAKNVNFADLATLITYIEMDYINTAYTFDIVDMRTGEVLAYRDIHGLWCINR